jgi:hypothetical protein
VPEHHAGVGTVVRADRSNGFERHGSAV